MRTIHEASSPTLGPIRVVKAEAHEGWSWSYRVLSGDAICFEGMTRREAMAWVSGHMTWAQSRVEA